MAKTIWHRAEDLAAFEEGRQANQRGAPRVAPEHYPTYNERAAFNDGWDSAAKDGRKRPGSKQDTR